MSDNKKGGKILDPKDADLLIDRGSDSQRRREEASKKRQKAEEAEKMTQDAGTDSQRRRNKGI
ncbi:hypothetical protein LY76DRAFT_597804 [Colletotrichum caudatum]|nr:hypothetical protein LY76DRAFT_597804 [Colletotrichum caudatum]